jgi:hypothetical protein
MRKLSLNDIGKPISEAKGWTECQVRHTGHRRENVIMMVIKVPSGQVLAITDYKTIQVKNTTARKCRAIKMFMRRNRRNGT